MSSTLRQQFLANPGINPHTGRKILIDGPTYKKLVIEFGRPTAHSIQVSSPRAASPRSYKPRAASPKVYKPRAASPKAARTYVPPAPMVNPVVPTKPVDDLPIVRRQSFESITSSDGHVLTIGDLEQVLKFDWKAATHILPGEIRTNVLPMMRKWEKDSTHELSLQLQSINALNDVSGRLVMVLPLKRLLDFCYLFNMKLKGTEIDMSRKEQIDRLLAAYNILSTRDKAFDQALSTRGAESNYYSGQGPDGALPRITNFPGWIESTAEGNVKVYSMYENAWMLRTLEGDLRMIPSGELRDVIASDPAFYNTEAIRNFM